MANKIQFKRGLKANLPTLNIAEPGFCTDTKDFYIGSSTGNIGFVKKDDIVINVKDFGAKGDGTTNDTTSIQNAINYCFANGGGIVRIPKGTYNINGVQIKSNVVILGEDIISTKLYQINNSTNHCIYSISSNNLTVKNLTIDANKANQTVNTYFGISINSFNKCLIENVEIKNASAHGIDCRYGENAIVKNCILHDNYNTGVNFNSIKNSEILNNDVNNNGMGGIYLESNNSNNCLIEGNIVCENGTETTHQGVLVQADKINITNNLIFDNLGNGIDLGNCKKIIVNSNHVEKNGNIGIEINSTDDSVVSNNIVIANGVTNHSPGIIVYESDGFTGKSNNNLIAGNRVTNDGTANQYIGIQLSVDSFNTVVRNNNVIGGGTNANIANDGNTNFIGDNIGDKTTQILTTSFNVSSVGDKWLSVVHGMGFTPDLSKITFGVQVIDAADFNASFPMAVSADSGSLTVKITVNTASSTTEATAKLIIKFN